MKDVGEPCAGEPHARIDVAGGGARWPVGKPARLADASSRPCEGLATTPPAPRCRQVSGGPDRQVRCADTQATEPASTGIEIPVMNEA
jgi:hypothetical protein